MLFAIELTNGVLDLSSSNEAGKSFCAVTIIFDGSFYIFFSGEIVNGLIVVQSILSHNSIIDVI